MKPAQPFDLVNLSEFDPSWNWLSSAAAWPAGSRWRHASAKSVAIPSWAPRPSTLRRAGAAWKAVSMLEAESLLVSHGPRMSLYGSIAMKARSKRQRHLAYSFNFTELPRGRARSLMAKSFRSIEHFVCFSKMERNLYARYFDLDIERFDMIHWAASPPSFDLHAPALIAGDYICAIGSQARDYATLVEAMRSLPTIKLVIVATPESVVGLALPANVELRCHIPLPEAMNILNHSRFNVIPLRDSEVPCGHVTIVSAMHSGKATIVSDSLGVADYVQNRVNGITVPANDALEMARAIDRLWGDIDESARLGAAARRFAQANCSEQNAVDYLANFMRLAPKHA